MPFSSSRKITLLINKVNCLIISSIDCQQVMLYLFARQISLSVATISIVPFLLLLIASNTSSRSLFNALENLVISDQVTLRQINFIASKSNIDEAENPYSIWLTPSDFNFRVISGLCIRFITFCDVCSLSFDVVSKIDVFFILQFPIFHYNKNT